MFCCLTNLLYLLQIPPYSVCAYLLDEQVYHNPAMNSLSGSATALNGDSNENSVSNAFKNRNRFTVRIFNSWIRDVHDDHLKTKETLLSQQRHQAISLYALQRSEWVLKLRVCSSHFLWLMFDKFSKTNDIVN